MMGETMISGFVGTIIGACVAYFSDWLKEKRKRSKEQHGAIVQAQLVMVAQLNTIENIEQQFLNKHRDDPDRHMKLISFNMEDCGFRVDFEKLCFLLTQRANLVMNIHAAQQCYVSAVNALKFRNLALDKLHSNSIPEKFDQNTGACTIKVKDPRDIRLVEDATDSLYEAIARAKESLNYQFRELGTVGKSLYPKRKFLLREDTQHELPNSQSGKVFIAEKR